MTDLEALLTDYLTISKAECSTGLIVFLLLKTEQQRLEMCRFLKDNPEASEREIIVAADKILQGPAPSLL